MKNIKLLYALVCAAVMLVIMSVSASAANYDDLYYEVSNGVVKITDCNTDASGALTIPSEIDGFPVTIIGDSAFYGCTSLTSVSIPDSVTSIGERAFLSCWRLTSVIIPDSVTSIGWGAFEGTALYNNADNWESGVLYINNSLIDANDNISGEYILRDGTTCIADYAFSDCTSLTSVVIPDSVTSIGWRAFVNCESLASITVDKNNTVYHSAGNCLIETGTKTLISGCNDSVIPNDSSVTIIGDSAFYNCTSLTSVIIPDSVTSIGSYAFCGCDSLTSVSIPGSVTIIGESAFRGCTSLASVSIPDSVTSIGRGAFEGCTSLTSVSIPDSVTSIGESAFRGCTSLESVIIPDSVTSIGEYAFYNCTSLTSVSIPDSVTSIGERAFHYCTSLESVRIPDSVRVIGSQAFENTALYNNADNWENNVLYIDNCLIKANNSISGGYTIKNSTILVATIAFDGCTSLTSVVIPDSVTSIGGSAFRGCTSLTSVSIPDSVTSIAGCAFYDCTSLASVSIPDSVTSIADYAFFRCTSLASVSIPDSVTSIGYMTFYNCNSLTDVYYAGTESEWNNISISYLNEPLLNANIHYSATPVISVSLDKSEITLEIGDTLGLTATVAPAQATNKAVNWASSDENIATVSADGVVTAKAAGSATITVTTADGGKSANCFVTVKNFADSTPVTPARLISGADIDVKFLDGTYVGEYDAVKDATVVTIAEERTPTTNENNYFTLGLGHTPVGEGANKITHVKIGYEISENTTLTTRDNLQVYMTLAAKGYGRFWGINIPYQHKADWVYDFTALNSLGGQGFAPGDYNNAVATDTYDRMRLGVFAWNQLVPAGTTFAVKYIAFFTNADDAANYVYTPTAPTETVTVTFKADGVQFGEVVVLDKGAALEYPETEPTKDGFTFKGWDVAAGTVVNENIVVNAIFEEIDDTAYVMYGNEIGIVKWLAWSYSTTDIVDNTAIINILDEQGAYWDNDGCHTLTFNGFEFPATHKYYVLGIGNNITKPATAATTHDNITFTIGGTPVLTDVNLAGDAVSAGPVYRIIDISDIVTDETARVTSVKIDPVWRINLDAHSADKSGGTRVGKGATFNFTVIAAFATLDDAEAFIAEQTPAETVTVTFKADGVQFGEVVVLDKGAALVYPEAVPEKDGFAFAGWSVPEGTVINSDITVNAEFTALNMPSLTVGNVKTRAGKTVTVPVTIENNPGILGLQFDIDYSDTLTLERIEHSDALADFTLTNPGEMTANPIRILFDGIDSDNSNGEFLLLTFTVADDAADGDYSVSIIPETVAAYDGETLEPVEFGIVDGFVTVKNYIPGDVNGDDVVNTLDITVLRRYIVGGYKVNVVEEAVDINKDGKVNTLDITFLRRYIVGGYNIILD